MYWWLLVIIGLFLECSALAQSEGRTALSNSYADFKKDNFSILQGPPITHLVPNFNTITYAVAFEKQDTLVRPAADENQYSQQGESLHFTGYTFAPHLAISLKKVGIGFSIENSKHQSYYVRDNGAGNLVEQKSSVATSGIGLNLSFLPFEKLRKEYKLAVIAGGKSLNVKHKWTNFQFDGLNEDVDNSSVTYTVLHYESGLNFTMKLLKNFSAIPWIDYSQNNISAAKDAVQEGKTDPQMYEIFQEDVENFWNRDPRLRYGIDLSLRLLNLDIRLGSALGAIGHLNSTPDYIIDKSFSLSLSIDQQGG